MLQFILTNTLMLALGGMLYLFVRTLPRVQEEEPKMGFMERWLASEMPEKMDNVMHRTLAKLFRKFRVYILKLDNLVTGRLERLKTREKEAQDTLPLVDATGDEGGNTNKDSDA